MVVAEKADVIKFWSPDLKRLAYKTWDEMSATEQNYIRDNKPELLPATQRIDTAQGRYDDLRRQFTRGLDASRDLTRDGQSPKIRVMAEWALGEYQLALELLNEAEQIPEDTDTQFCCYPDGEMFRTRMPPRHNEDDRGADINSDDAVITFHNHVYRTSSPLRIAWLRRCIRSGMVHNLHEVKVGQYPMIDKESGALLGWTDYQSYLNGVASGAFAK